MPARTGLIEPPIYLTNGRLATWEIVEELGMTASFELNHLNRKLMEEAMQMSQEERRLREKILITTGRILYARLLCGQVAPEDRDEIESCLAHSIHNGLWPHYESDMKFIRSVIKSCGFLPGHPLTARAKETLAETDARRAREAAEELAKALAEEQAATQPPQQVS